MHALTFDGFGTTPVRVPSRVATALATLGVLLLQGCATPGRSIPDTGYQAGLGRIAVVATAADPEIKFEAFGLGQGESAAIGATSLLSSCMQVAVRTGCNAVACAPILLFGLGYCALAAAVGGVAGAALAPSAESVEAAKTHLSAAVVTETIQESLRNRVVVACAPMAPSWST